MPGADDLIAIMQRQDEVGARELASLLKVSQPTISRLLASVGDRVCRMGRGRATRYALTRSLPALGTSLPVRQVDENGASHAYGTIHLLTNGRHWLQRENGAGELFRGMPPFAWDMSPQGYIGRRFPAAY